MREVVVLAAGVDHQEQPVLAEIGDHQVVDDAARLVGEQRVALPPRLQPEQVAGHQPLQRSRGVGAGQRRLAHMRDVEQRGLARGSAGARPARPGTAPAWHSRRTAPCARRARGARHRAAWSSAAWAWGRPAAHSRSLVRSADEVTAPATCRCPMTPLCRGDLRDSGPAADGAPYSVGAAGAWSPAGFPEIPDPDAVPGA